MWRMNSEIRCISDFYERILLQSCVCGCLYDCQLWYLSGVRKSVSCDSKALPSEKEEHLVNETKLKIIEILQVTIFITGNKFVWGDQYLSSYQGQLFSYFCFGRYCFSLNHCLVINSCHCCWLVIWCQLINWILTLLFVVAVYFECSTGLSYFLSALNLQGGGGAKLQQIRRRYDIYIQLYFAKWPQTH